MNPNKKFKLFALLSDSKDRKKFKRKKDKRSKGIGGLSPAITNEMMKTKGKSNKKSMFARAR